MKILSTTFKVLTCAIFTLALSSLASAATRTWVSGLGDDANPCSRTAPCKTYAGALSKKPDIAEVHAPFTHQEVILREALGLGRSNIVFSDATNEEMWVEGGKYGSIDPCFPSKVAQAHVHNLLFHKHEPDRKRPLNYIFFPILTHVNNFVEDTQDNTSCPIVAGTPHLRRRENA